MWETPVFTPPADADTTAAVLGAIAALTLGVLLFLAPSLERTTLRELRPVAAAVLILVGALATGIPILVVGTAVAVAAVALVCLTRAAVRWGWATVAGIAALTAFLAGLASPWLWAIGVAVALAVPLIARATTHPAAEAAVVLALAPVVVGAAAALIAPSAIAVALGVDVDVRAGLALVQWVALAALAAAVLLRMDAASRSAVAISSYALILLSFMAFVAEPAGVATVSATIGEPALSIVRTGGILILLVLVALQRTRIGALPSLPAALLAAPVAATLGLGILDTAGVTDPGWITVTTTAVAAVVVWSGALLAGRREGTYSVEGEASSTADAISGNLPAALRTAGDIGGAASVLVVASIVPVDFRWSVLALAGLALAGTSVTRHWAGPIAAAMDGVWHTTATGAPLARAPRRLLVWPAYAAAALALWSWLYDSGSYEIEAFALPPAVGLVLLAAALVWLRRPVEATIAVTLGFGLGLVLPAIAGTSGSAVRGVVVAIVAAGVALVLAWTPARRVRMPALAGALVALTALTIVGGGPSPVGSAGAGVAPPAGGRRLRICLRVPPRSPTAAGHPRACRLRAGRRVARAPLRSARPADRARRGSAVGLPVARRTARRDDRLRDPRCTPPCGRAPRRRPARRRHPMDRVRSCRRDRGRGVASG